ncbi:MAG: hypothetical protein GVY23_03670 [Spirochaetes bacterium]|nr:hypothetical protein [Spirochaetota bacterium]
MDSTATRGGERKHPQAHHKPTRQTHHHKPTAKTSVEDRLEYYRRKYGEDFELSDSTAGRSAGDGRRSGGGRPAGGGDTGSGRSSGAARSGDGTSSAGSSDEKSQDFSSRERGEGENSSVWRRIGRIFGGS